MNKAAISKLQVIQGDITTLAVDAIVNAANNSLLGGGGVDGAIHRAAGPELLAECKIIGGCPTGEARITRGYKLPSKYVIHTVGPIYSGTEKDATLLTSCYKNCLFLARDHHIQSIAFPLVSCGVYGYPVDEACRIAVNTTIEYLKDLPSIQKVLFVPFSRDHYNVYNDYINNL